MKNFIKQTGFVFFFGILTRGLFACNSSDDKKIACSESDNVTSIDGWGSLGNADGKVTDSRNYFLSILMIIIVILVSGGCEVKVVKLDPGAEKVNVIREFESTAEEITQDRMTIRGRGFDAETEQYGFTQGDRWTEEFKNWISKGDGISFEEEELSRKSLKNAYASGMIEGCDSIKFVSYTLGNDIIRTSDTIHTVAYRLPFQLPRPWFDLPYKNGNCYHVPHIVRSCGGGGGLSWMFADESTKMKQFQNIAKRFGLIHGANYAVIHGLDGSEMTLGLYKCSE